MTAALEAGECSAAHAGRTLPLGKTRYPFYRRLGGPQGRSGRTENLAPTGIRSRTVQPVVSRYTDWATCIYRTVELLPGKTLRSYRGNLKNVFIYKYMILHLATTKEHHQNRTRGFPQYFTPYRHKYNLKHVEHAFPQQYKFHEMCLNKEHATSLCSWCETHRNCWENYDIYIYIYIYIHTCNK